MTKEETLSFLHAYLDGDIHVGNIFPLRELIKTAVLLIEDYESLPKIHGWVARDMDGELNFFGSELGDGEPIYNGDLGVWGNATDNKINISRESGPFGDLNYYDDPVEVELLVRRV